MLISGGRGIVGDCGHVLSLSLDPSSYLHHTYYRALYLVNLGT